MIYSYIKIYWDELGKNLEKWQKMYAFVQVKLNNTVNIALFSKAACNFHNCKFSSKVLTVKVSETFQDQNIYSNEKEIFNFLKDSAKDETF